MSDVVGEPAAADRPRVSVIVATRNRPHSLASALDAIERVTGPGDELIVVDSASSDDETRAVASAHGAVYRRADVPGASHARNLGVRHAAGDVVAFTDDDCRPRPGWTAAFADVFADPRVGLAVGPVTGIGGGSAADVGDRGPLRWRWPDDPARFGSGASMAVRRAAFVDVGGFDERLGPGASVGAGEDHELFLRLLWSGWEAAFAPGAHVDHDDRRGRLATLRLFYGYGIGAGTVAAMARSMDPAVARRMLSDRLWAHGVRLVARDLARRWEEPAARGAAMTAGVVVGWTRARHLRSTVRTKGPRSGPITNG